jgi:TrmH family RNA methyltransferase
VSALRLILVSPMHASNVGAVARLCGNFGINDVVLVAPRCDPLSEDAKALATHHARQLLEGFSVVEQLRDAIRGSETVIGFSRRLGDQRRPDISWERLSSHVPTEGRLDLVFGPEDTGLSHGDLTMCSHLCSLPTHPSVPSLNLSQAVAVVLSGLLWNQAGDVEQKGPLVKTRFQDEKPISSESLLSLIEHWKKVMIDVELTKDGNPDRLLHYYHRILLRAELSEREGNMLRGFLSQIQITLGTRKLKREH